MNGLAYEPPADLPVVIPAAQRQPVADLIYERVRHLEAAIGRTPALQVRRRGDLARVAADLRDLADQIAP